MFDIYVKTPCPVLEIVYSEGFIQRMVRTIELSQTRTPLRMMAWLWQDIVGKYIHTYTILGDIGKWEETG